VTNVRRCSKLKIFYDGFNYIGVNYYTNYDKVTLTIDKISCDIIECKSAEKLKKISQYGKHKICDVNFKWYDGIIICPKCNFILDLE
jgi:hypothetical protein